MWNRTKGDSLFSGMSYLIIAVIIVVVAFVIYRFIKKAKSKKKRPGNGNRQEYTLWSANLTAFLSLV